MAEFPPPASIKEALSYDASLGVFVWLKTKNNKVRPGSIAGVINNCGYRRIKFEGIDYPSSRLAWWFVFGEWPKYLDHINARRSDDRIANLRKATASENARNRSSAKGSSSRFLGVSRFRGRQWRASIQSPGHPVHIGYFTSEEEAARAYDRVASRLHSEFARLNFPAEMSP